MCGIVGVVERGDADLQSITVAMRDRLAHRGPDGAGARTWPDHGVALGHRRLAIIDPSAAAAQPMSNEDGTVWTVFNGEICNFRELRHELEGHGHAFRTASDTEVIVHAYEQWGDDHVHRLRGFFAYAVYDRRPSAGGDGRVVLVRDRLGVKPLCYHLQGDRLVFGSEIKAVLAHPRVDRALDRSALFDYFTYSCIPAPKTAYRAVRKLLPGHRLVMEHGACSVTRYWDVECAASAGHHDEREVAEEVSRAVADAVRAYTTSDVPVGAWLSGGVDSSLVTALLAETLPEPQTFSLAFDTPDRDETRFAEMTARHCRTRHTVTRIDHQIVPGLEASMVQIFDEPYADGSAAPTWCLAQTSGARVKAVLSGDGGDEVFGGYNRYGTWLSAHGAAAAGTLRRQAGRMLSRLRGAAAVDPFLAYVRQMELFSPAEKRALLTPEWSREFDGYDDYWSYRLHWRRELEPATRLQYCDLKTYLPDDILTKVDAVAMAASLEVRPPLLDHRLVQSVLALPAAVRNPQAQPKHLLKRAAAAWVPDEIINRRKQGFSAPWTTWITAQRGWAETKLAAAPPGLFRANPATGGGIPRYGEKTWAALIAEEFLARQYPGARRLTARPN